MNTKEIRNDCERGIKMPKESPAESGEVERLTRLLNEYGGQRCTNVCPPGTDCTVAHWCLLAQDHEGDHVHLCATKRLRAKAIAKCVEIVKANSWCAHDDPACTHVSEITTALELLAKGEGEDESR